MAGFPVRDDQLKELKEHSNLLQQVVNTLEDGIDIGSLPQQVGLATDSNLNTLLAKGTQTVSNSIGVNIASDQILKITKTPTIGGGYGVHYTNFGTLSTASTVKDNVRTTAVSINWVYVYSSVNCFFRLSNSATNPILNSSSYQYTYFIPANVPQYISIPDTRFATALAYNLTGAITAGDSTALPSGTTYIININLIS